MIRLAVAGATGRMGGCIFSLAARDERFKIVAALVEHSSDSLGKTLHDGQRDIPLTSSIDVPCDVVIDFTTPDGTMALIDPCRQHGAALVCGVTGHDERQLVRIQEAARFIPLLKAPNFSWGMSVISRLIGRIARELGEAYDVELVEIHHRDKVDAPSGTARTLAEQIAKAAARERESCVIHGRQGRTGVRPAGQIGIHAVRMGDSVGTHDVHFSGSGETITIHHQAHTRDCFASGALRAAAWLVRREPGRLYTLDDLA